MNKRFDKNVKTNDPINVRFKSKHTHLKVARNIVETFKIKCQREKEMASD